MESKVCELIFHICVLYYISNILSGEHCNLLVVSIEEFLR